MTTTTTTPFWLYDYEVLFKEWDAFYPTQDMTRDEQLNALTRFCVYSALLLYAARPSTQYLGYLAFALCLIIVAHRHLPTNTTDDHDTTTAMAAAAVVVGVGEVDGVRCLPPTPNNPFMNRAVGDTRHADLPACADRSEEADAVWRAGLFQNVDDVYDRHLNSRQFYTVSDSRLPNDQTAFAMALYGDGARGREDGTCKENRRQCFDHAYF